MTQLAVQQVSNYAALIEKAVENNSLEIVEKMMDLQDRHDRKAAKSAFDNAKAEFKKNAPTIVKDKTGNKWKYADLVQVVAKATPVLSKYGLSSDWSTQSEPERRTVTVTCHLTHIDGHSESVTLSEMYDESGSKNRMQAMASAVSYLERYTFMAITGLAAGGEDDDGYAAAPQPDIPLIKSMLMASDAIGVYLLHKQANETSDEAQIQLGHDIKSGIGDGMKGEIVKRATELREAGKIDFEKLAVALLDGDAKTVKEIAMEMTGATRKLLNQMDKEMITSIKEYL